MISPWMFLAVCAGGGVGAAARLLVDGLVRSRTGTAFPVATLVINVTGSFALGLVVGVADGLGLPREFSLVLGGGVLGGFTTFSTAAVETVRLLTDGRWGLAAVNGIGMLVLTVGAALLGLLLGIRV